MSKDPSASKDLLGRGPEIRGSASKPEASKDPSKLGPFGGLRTMPAPAGDEVKDSTSKDPFKPASEPGASKDPSK